MHASQCVEDWLLMIHGEFDELPGLRLTLSEAADRWELDQDVLDPILRAFVDRGVLRVLPDGSFVCVGSTGQATTGATQH